MTGMRLLISSILSLLLIHLHSESVFAQDKESQPRQRHQRHRWVEFYQEHVSITCHEEDAHIEGIYYLRNLTDGAITMTIQYPFPVNEYHPFPREIETDGLPFRQDSSNIYLSMALRPREEKSFRIFYRQFHNNKRITYILSTTQHWGQPIQRAEFIVSVPAGWNPTLSLAPDRKEAKDGRVIYHILRNNFFPNEDLIIEWQ